MMNRLELEKYNIIKDVKKTKKETNNNAIKVIRNLFGLKKENEAIKGRIIRDIKKFLEKEKKIITNQ